LGCYSNLYAVSDMNKLSADATVEHYIPVGRVNLAELSNILVVGFVPCICRKIYELCSVVPTVKRTLMLAHSGKAILGFLI
jgi:hypothetical protein